LYASSADETAAMPLYWLVYRHNNQISVVIEPGDSVIHACMRAALLGLMTISPKATNLIASQLRVSFNGSANSTI
jgi:hypothetical protein